MRVLMINGPNLNLLGTRDKEIYGDRSLIDLEQSVVAWASKSGCEVETIQSNDETSIIESIQNSRHDAIVLNAGALTHTSRALGDAIASVETPVVEVHISNVKAREPWRARSVISAACVRTIYGRGHRGYRDAIRHLMNRSEVDFEAIRYGPHEENLGDLRVHGDDLVVLVHGGFWMQAWERDTMESLATSLHREGFSTWNIEYRRIGCDGEWPAPAHDVLMALDFVPQLGLDLRSASVLGHSAGGYLGMWAAPRSQVEVSLLVSLAGISDLEAHAESGLAGATEARALIEGGAPPQSDPRGVATALFHDRTDEQVPFQHSVVLADRHELALSETDSGHFGLLDPKRDHWTKVVEMLRTTTGST